MNLVENLLNLGVIKIDFDIELERTIFEMKYLIEQKEVIYSFIDFEEWDEVKQSNYTIYEIDLFF
ncbi:MAG: hypothetical protein KA384_04420 [Leptotrichiaceae bacterium]|nr:hypothetical protein [Leptotrichiaceae bacterium]MBP9595446.1 hypothetical protein [Fusobacteriaceae bacterium]